MALLASAIRGVGLIVRTTTGFDKRCAEIGAVYTLDCHAQ